MFRNLYYRLFCQSDLNNTNGLKRFGERCINSLLGRAKQRSASARKNTLKLRVAQAGTEEYLKSVQVDRLLEDDEFFGIRKKVLMGTWFIGGIFVTECLLAYYSTLVLIAGTDIDTTLLRWLLALALTLGAISTSEKLLEALLPQRFHNEDTVPARSLPVILLWSVLLILVMLGVVAVAEARVRDIEGGHTGSIVYFGFIALSMVLPLIAGTIAWEISRFYDAYKQTRKYRRARLRLEKLTQRIERNIQREEDAYTVMLTSYWDRYNDFRSYKENYDLRKGVAAGPGEKFCPDFEEFKRIASLRYGPVRRSVVHDAEVLVLPPVNGNGTHFAETDHAEAEFSEEFVPVASVRDVSLPKAKTNGKAHRTTAKRPARKSRHRR